MYGCEREVASKIWWYEREGASKVYGCEREVASKRLWYEREGASKVYGCEREVASKRWWYDREGASKVYGCEREVASKICPEVWVISAKIYSHRVDFPSAITLMYIQSLTHGLCMRA